MVGNPRRASDWAARWFLAKRAARREPHELTHDGLGEDGEDGEDHVRGTMMKKRCLEPGCSILTGRGSYCTAHRRTRARRYSDPTYQANRLAVLVAAGYHCHCPGCGMCDGHCTTPANTVDHITPLDRGGTSAIGNLRSCCRACNSSKSNL